MGDSRKLDASQRQELAWLLDEADSAVQSWWQAEQVRWPDILTTLVSRLRLCGFDLEAEGIASDVQAAPKIGRQGCRNHRDLMQLRQQVVDRVRKRIVAIRKVMADEATHAGGGMGWQEARDEADKLRLAGDPWTSYRKMAKAIGCHASVLHDAISKYGTVELQEWASKQRGPSRLNVSPKTAAVALEKTPQSRESDPGNAIEQPDVDAAMQFLIEQAKRKHPELGAKTESRIQSMDDADRRALAEQVYDDPDKAEQAERYQRRAWERQD